MHDVYVYMYNVLCMYGKGAIVYREYVRSMREVHAYMERGYHA
jgi:hypothetical protein